MDERLKKIKRLWNEANDICEPCDYEWLIQQAELRQEQIDKNLQALENIDVIQRSYEKLERENNRYKEALEKIEEEINGNAEGLDAERELDEAKEIAHRALKGEST